MKTSKKFESKSNKKREHSDEQPEVFMVKKNTTNHSNGRREFIVNSILVGASAPLVSSVLTGCEDDDKPKSVYKSFKALSHDSDVVATAFSPDGKILASASVSDVSAIKFWSIPDGTLLRTIEDTTCWGYNRICFSPDGSMLVSSSGCGTKVWSVTNGEKLISLSEISSNAMQFSPDGKYLAFSDASPSITIWKVADWSIVKTIDSILLNILNLSDTISLYNIIGLYFNKEENSLLSVTSECNFTLWSFPNGDLIKTWQGSSGNTNLLCLNTDETLIASVSSGNYLTLLSYPDCNFIKSLENADSFYINSICFNPKGTMLATGGSNIVIWSVPDGQILQTLKEHTNSVTSLCFNPDSTILASGSNDKTVRLWNVADGTELLPKNAFCSCDTVCTCDTVTSDNDSKVCTCNTIESCSCNEVCSCNAVSSGGGGGSYWYPN